MESPRRGAFGGSASGRAAAEAARMDAGESEVTPPESSVLQLQNPDAFEPAPDGATSGLNLDASSDHIAAALGAAVKSSNPVAALQEILHSDMMEIPNLAKRDDLDQLATQFQRVYDQFGSGAPRRWFNLLFNRSGSSEGLLADALQSISTAAALRKDSTQTALRSEPSQTALASKPSQETIEAEFARALESDGNSTAAVRVRNHPEGQLDFSDLRLARLPKEIGNLTALQTLALYNNILTSLPAEIGSLTALNKLNLSRNHLTSLPAEIGSLTALKNLHLDSNRLTSLPAEMGNLTALDWLVLSNNQLTSLPAEMGNLTALDSLWLGNNRLTSLPAEIGKLTASKSLWLDCNQLTSLPAEIGNLTELNDLKMGYNQLTSLPPEMGNLTALKQLALDRNRLTSLPAEIGSLTALNKLWLSDNQLTSLPPEMGNLTALNQLYLSNNQLTSVPASIANLRNLRVLDLTGNPIAARGENESTWGREELRRHFGDRVLFDEPRAVEMPAGTTQADVLSALDRQPVRINRKQLQEARVPEITTPTIEDGASFLDEFAKLYSNLNFNQPDKPGYLSYEQLAGDWSNYGSADTRSNDEKVLHRVIPKLTGYFKTLYQMPLDKVEQESGSWQMYDDKVPALKKALSYVIPSINGLEDSDQRAILFQQFVDGMLHCPTGQSEGIDTVVNALQGGRIARSSDLAEVFRKIIALRKNSGFRMAVLSKAASNSQNVHVISKYQNALREELGLDNVLNFDEKMGTMGVDPFNDNPWNVLKTFYDLVTPQRMADWIMERATSSDDLNQKQKLRDLQKQRAAASSSSAPAMRALREELEEQKAALNNPALSAKEAEIIQTRVQQLEGLLGITAGASVPLDKEGIKELDARILELKNQIHQTHAFKPLEPQDVVQYLQDTNQIHPDDNPDWWRGYFSADPEIDASAVLTREGALKLLQQLGYVTQAP